MKIRLIVAFVVLLTVGAGLIGYFSRDTSITDVVGPEIKAVADNDKTPIALELFRHGSELAQFREGLNLLSPNLTRPDVAPRLSLKDEDRKFLESEAKLTAAEIQELESTNFLSLDAVFVNNAALFRDAARTLEIPGLSALAQAEFAFDWTTRRVLLYEQQMDGVPPAYVLRAGHGAATERGLVFLALVHQYRLEGCLLALPGASDAPLVGVLIDQKLRLFDTRLGLPVPAAKGQGIATWDDVVKDPNLLKNGKLSAEQVGQLEARIAAPLESLAPRMKYLEALLQGEETHVGGERIGVFHDAAALGRDLRAAGLTKVGFWAPALRLERQFASVDDGGLDKTKRAMRFVENQVPWPPILRRYQELRISGDLPRLAHDRMLALTNRLLDKYDREPTEMLIRGKVDLLPRRLERMRAAVDDAAFASPQQEQVLLKEAAKWRQRVNEAYLALARDPDGAQKVAALWEEDQYLGYLLNPEVEDVPRNAAKKVLSKLVLAAVREPFGARVNWLSASLSQDKAERARQTWLAQKAAGKEGKVAGAEAKKAWLNARSGWNKYLDRNLGPSAFVAGVPNVRSMPPELALAQWEYLHKELHQYASARLEQARAIEQMGQNPDALLGPLVEELERLLKDDALAKARAAAVASGMPMAALDGPRRWELLARDWGADGNLAWMIESIRLSRPSATRQP